MIGENKNSRSSIDNHGQPHAHSLAAAAASSGGPQSETTAASCTKMMSGLDNAHSRMILSINSDQIDLGK